MQQKSVLPPVQLCREWERRNYPQCNMISPTMHTRWHSICVCVFFLGGILKLLDFDSRGGQISIGGGHILKLSDLDSLSNFNFGGGILYGFSICVTSIFKYYALFHECLGYYSYLLLFPIIFTLLLIFH